MDLPNSLPEIDAVEIVDLCVIEVNRVSDYMVNSQSAPHWLITGEDAQRLASLWRQLTPGESARCHLPPFGYRFFAAGKLRLEVSVCWKCDNIYGTFDARPWSFAFVSDEPAAQELLRETRRLSGVQSTKAARDD